MSDGQADLEAAIGRLDKAISGLETKVRGLKSRPAVPEDDLFASAAAADEREQALERAAQEASEALGQAAAEIRAVLEEA
ncbi:MAG TPA: hypothetical protein VEA15_02015 [Caulobacteraceae bacterium]|nr:hypothetical protein [Caulobacteraceae bacterium]